jgi:hypothetical protein
MNQGSHLVLILVLEWKKQAVRLPRHRANVRHFAPPVLRFEAVCPWIAEAAELLGRVLSRL